LLFLALAYAGVLQFVGAFSPYALHACYAGIAACAAVCVLMEPRAVDRVGPFGPYLLWIAFYVIWGTIIAWDPSQVLSDAVRVVLRNCVLAGAFAIAVGGQRHLGALARLFQVGAVVNCAICLYEAQNPRLIEDIARFLNPATTAFSVSRPAGLWSNPNEAAFAFLFSLLLSHWDRSLWAWAGRLASVAGIYLTASRTGLYLLLFCGLLYGLLKLAALLRDPRRVAIALNVAWVAGFALVLLLLTVPMSFDVSDSYNVQRLLDYSESATRGGRGDTRVEVAADAFEAALRSPLVGYGLFAFQDLGTAEHGEAVTSAGAHNIYLAVFGEVGLVGLAGYLAVLGLGVVRLIGVRARREDWFIGALLWSTYLLIGFTWHNQLTSMLGVIYVAVLYSIPRLIARPARAPGDRLAPAQNGAAHVRTCPAG
jgi:O-antigen ligase